MVASHRAHWRTTVLVSVALLTGGCMSNAAPSESNLTGTATYRERIALPPGAVFEATLEDVTRADAPADLEPARRARPVASVGASICRWAGGAVTGCAAATAVWNPPRVGFG